MLFTCLMLLFTLIKPLALAEVRLHLGFANIYRFCYLRVFMERISCRYRGHIVYYEFFALPLKKRGSNNSYVS